MEQFSDVSAPGASDNLALADPPAAAAPWSPPLPGTEEILAGIWAELLEADRVSALHTFFRLGGYSLLATQMGFKVRKALGVALPTSVLFEPWTLRRLAEWIDARRGSGDTAEARPPLVRTPRGAPLPATLLQEFYWMQHQIDPGSISANMPYAVRLGGALRVPALERALAEVARRHESLRTTFIAPDGVPVQVVGESGPVRIPCVDLSRLPPAAREPRALRLAAREAARPFDLQRGPLLRALLLRLDTREWVLLVTVHHIVTDGWSMDVLVREVGALYGAFARGKAPSLPEPEVQYGDYAVWQRGWLQGAVLEQYAGWWRNRLAGAQPLDLAGEGPGLSRVSPRRSLAFTLPVTLRDDLRRLGGNEGATLFMVLLAAFKAMLVRYTSQPDVTVQTPLGGRRQPELASTIGFFAQVALLRTDLSGDPTFRELMRRVRETTLGAYDHQELPLLERLGAGVARETTAYQRLCRMGFVLEETGKEPLVLGDLSVEPVGSPGCSAARMDMLALSESASGLTGSFVYRTDVFPEAVVAQAIRHYGEVLEQVVANPDARLSELVLSAP